MAPFFSYSVIGISALFIIVSVFPQVIGLRESYDKEVPLMVAPMEKEEVPVVPPIPTIPPLDKVAYDLKMHLLANNPPEPVPVSAGDAVSLVETESSAPTQPAKPTLWPVKAPYPKDGAILPFKRVIAYYGNLYSTKMGVLGEYPEAEMFERLNTEVKKWEKADPETPVVPALHYIVTTAQISPGKDGKHRLRMPGSEIEKVLAMAEKINAIVFLDVQVGFSTLEAELPVLEKYLKLPNVHLGVDPEFSMKGDIRPGKVVGTFDAVDINYATDFLARIVKENDLTPKILVVHRYTQKMLTNYKAMKTVPEVQIVIHMDGWGPKAKKINTYRQFVYSEPVQFAGFKIFYKNDLWDPGTVLFSPEELLQLRPIPVYIQYQ
ncbi:MAG TPA: hypothetical protein VFQ59_00285 [Candidatus Paceibacterota bacterium]|nr:hypothetical protein [Candidatus Paceibacterota bacterium]